MPPKRNPKDGDSQYESKHRRAIFCLTPPVRDGTLNLKAAGTARLRATVSKRHNHAASAHDRGTRCRGTGVDHVVTWGCEASPKSLPKRKCGVHALSFYPPTHISATSGAVNGLAFPTTYAVPLDAVDCVWTNYGQRAADFITCPRQSSCKSPYYGVSK